MIRLNIFSVCFVLCLFMTDTNATIYTGFFTTTNAREILILEKKYRVCISAVFRSSEETFLPPVTTPIRKHMGMTCNSFVSFPAVLFSKTKIFWSYILVRHPI